ncbi:MAG: cysteine desulfurase family protein [Clostridia bacterium]
MIYFDNAATTKMFEECLQAYKTYACDNFFNPSALYHPSIEVTNCINDARSFIAKKLGASADELIFTASGTESDNMAMFGCFKRNKSRILISNVEHSAIYNSALELKNRGFDVQLIPVNQDGAVNIEEFKKMLTNEVSLVSIMNVCNETGAINDIKNLVSLTKSLAPNAFFHSDGVQAFGKINVNLKNLGVDFYSISGHKIHAPKGIGALYIKKGVRLTPIIFGGGQEKNLRSATENVASIMAFKVATEKTFDTFNATSEHLLQLKSYFISKLKQFDDVLVISNETTSNHIVHFAIKNVKSEILLHSLEKHQIYIGNGSACSAKKASYRIANALNVPQEYKNGLLRVSFDFSNTTEEINIFIEAMKTELQNILEYNS